jgi:hypothetical protein
MNTPIPTKDIVDSLLDELIGGLIQAQEEATRLCLIEGGAK